MLETQTHNVAMHKNESEARARTHTHTQTHTHIYIYIYISFKKFQLALTRVTLHKKRHCNFPLPSKRLLEHKSPFAYRMKNSPSFSQIPQTLAKKNFMLEESNFIFCIFVLRLLLKKAIKVQHKIITSFSTSFRL